jgi:F0F1-type ATP synthase assembly protein I
MFQMKVINPAPWGKDFIFVSNKMAEEKTQPAKSVKDLAMGMALYSSFSVLGPLIVFGVAGYFLDRAFHGHNFILLFSIFIAFVVTNILIFRKAFAIMAELKNFKGNGKNGYDEDEENDK